MLCVLCVDRSTHVLRRVLAPLFPAFPFFLSCVLVFCLVLPPLCCCAADARKVVIPFDFVSKFDDGRYGQIVGDMIWKKLSADGGFIVPEIDARRPRLLRKPQAAALARDGPCDKMKQIVADDFGGQIGIWGSVERAPGTRGRNLRPGDQMRRFLGETEAEGDLRVKARTKSVSEIPHLYVKADARRAARRRPAAAAWPTPLAESELEEEQEPRRRRFPARRRRRAQGLGQAAGQQREPLGGLVRWTTEKGNADNKVVRFTLDRNVAENEGVMYYSDFFPVEEGATYRFQCRWRSTAPAVKVFIKCYDD